MLEQLALLVICVIAASCMVGLTIMDVIHHRFILSKPQKITMYLLTTVFICEAVVSFYLIGVIL